MSQPKSPARLRLEEKVTVRELTQDLDYDLQKPALTELAEKKASPRYSRSILKMIAGLVLLAGLGMVVLPAIGQGWMMFFFGLSYYFWQFFNGLAVVVGALIILGAVYVIVFK